MIAAYKGDLEYENVDQLKSDISELVESENFGILIGSGASIDAGGLDMKNLWKHFESNNNATIEWLSERKFISTTGNGYVNYKKSTLSVDALLDDLSIAISYQERLDDVDIIKTKKAKLKLMQEIISAGQLNEQLWYKPETRRNSLALKNHISILQKIENIRHGISAPWFFTTNYDLAIEWAAKSIGMKIVTGALDTGQNLSRPYIFDFFEDSKEPNLIKLHGSLSWKRINNEIYELLEKFTFDQTRKFIGGMSRDLEFLVFPGSLKYLKTIEFLYGELLRLFGNFLAKANPVLFVVGYGFGDLHINQQIKSALFYRKDLKVVIYFPELENLNNIDELPYDLKSIIDQKDSRVIIVGGGKDAYFDAFANHLPEI